MVNKADKNEARLRRHRRVRGKISGTAERPRLDVFRSAKHIYCQVIDDEAGVTLASASTLEKDFEDYGGNCDAAKKVGAKVIGVDVDQAGVIAGYAGVEGMTVTSAMKGLYPTTYDTLTDVIVNGNWDAYKGKIATLGLVSGDDPELNYVQIPMGEGTQWSDSFTQDDYKAMVKDMFDGKITVSNDVSKAPSDFATGALSRAKRRTQIHTRKGTSERTFLFYLPKEGGTENHWHPGGMGHFGC